MRPELAQHHSGPPIPGLPPAPGATGAPAQLRTAVVVGAGLAGAAVANRLARRGWQVAVLDAVGAAAGASALAAGLAHWRLAAEEDRIARLTRAGLESLHAELATLAPELRRDGGVLMAGDRLHSKTIRVQWPPELARPLDAQQLGQLAGVDAARGGWWTAGCAVAASSLVQRWLDQPGIALHRCSRVQRLQRDGRGGWQAMDVDDRPLATAAVCIVANAMDCERLLRASAIDIGTLQLRAQAGQGFVIAADELPPLQGLAIGAMANAYAIPLPAAALQQEGLEPERSWLFVGATYEDDPLQPLPAAAVWDHIRTGLEPLAGALPQQLPASARRFHGVRALAPGRLPLIGAWPGQPGLYLSAAMGSRGLLLSALAAAVITSALEGEPAPLPLDLLRALDPGRYVKQARSAT